MKYYKLNPYGNLYTTTALFQNSDRKYYAVLLIDSGSSYTILNPDILENLNIDTTVGKKVRILTASGNEFCRQVSTGNFFCFGLRIDNFPLLSHSIPFGANIDGILGMDFFNKFDLNFKIKEGLMIRHDIVNEI